MPRLLILLALASALCAAVGVGPASAHRHPCHLRHECPSDHATYRWHGMYCVKPTSPERTRAFRKRVVYAGRVYYCKR